MLVVVGAGIAGSWLTRAARAAGIETVLIGDGIPASLVAVGLLRPSHLSETDRRLLGPSLEAWESTGTLFHKGAYVTRWDRPEGKTQGDWWVVDPSTSCLEPDIVGRAEPRGPGAVAVDGRALAGTIVWCDGGGNGRRTYGVTWRHPDPAAVRRLFAVHHIAPYKILAATSFPTGARVGSSSSNSPDRALEQAEKMFALAGERGLLTATEGWECLPGTRLKRDQTLAADGPDGAWRWSGFHRTGYGVVPADAARVLRTVAA